MKTRIAAFLALLFSLALTGIVVSPAQATRTVDTPAVQTNHNRYGPQTTGGNVYNAYWSESSLKITDDRPAHSYQVMGRGQRSGQNGFYSNVQGFRVESGYNAINTNTGYIYVGGQWHYMCCNNTFLSLAVDWLGNPPPHAMSSIDGFQYEVLALKTGDPSYVTGGVVSGIDGHVMALKTKNTWTWGG